MVPEREMRREPENSSIPVPRFQRGDGILNHTGGTYSHGGFDGLHDIFKLGNATRKIPRLYGISKLEGQLKRKKKRKERCLFTGYVVVCILSTVKTENTHTNLQFHSHSPECSIQQKEKTQQNI